MLISGKLWLTENGPDIGDENMVAPGFNSGWPLITGSNFIRNDTPYYDATLPNELCDFGSRGHYSSPHFDLDMLIR